MKLWTVLLLAILMFSVVINAQGEDAEADAEGDPAVDGSEEEGEEAPPPEADPNASVALNMKAAERRTPNEILTDIQSAPDGILDVTIYLKNDQSNKKQKENNAEELEKYERFFSAVEDGSGACQPSQSVVVDIVDASEQLANELVSKTEMKESKVFDFRTIVTFLLDGDGYKVWGPTAYKELCRLWLLPEHGYFACSEEDCRKQFFEIEETEEEETDGEGEGDDGEGEAGEGDDAAAE